HEPRMMLISGEDAINYPILSNGGKGVISVTSNLLPDMISALTHFALDENYKEAKKSMMSFIISIKFYFAKVILFLLKRLCI
ncbi:dihydrodipicolinate synthase family protein, partial [Campylobacter jejuni]|nr:dihydrodipicolinate synthase family protein [Campylobacter jejuni]